MLMEIVGFILCCISGFGCIALCCYIAYKLGILAERERRMRLEAAAERRIWQQFQRTTEKDRELWETELEVGND